MAIASTRNILFGFHTGAPGGEPDFGEAQEESFQTGTMKFRFGKVGCRHCLLGSIPEALFERCGGGVFFRWSNPVHGDP